MVERAIKEFLAIYEKVKEKHHIAKPVTYALYATARSIEKIERRRDEDQHD